MTFEKLQGDSLSELIYRLNSYFKHYSNKFKIEVDDLKKDKNNHWSTTISRELK